jgi:RNA polymerase sigma factor (sigma-70 family)
MVHDRGDVGSVTLWIAQLRLGDSAAAQQLWERYYASLVRLAEKRLRGVPLRVADEDDVVQSAFASFCGRVEKGAFPRLQDRDDLWRLLVAITARKAINYLRRSNAEKRGGSATNRPFDLLSPDIEGVVGNEPTPEFALQTAETLRDLLACLPTESVRDLVLKKMEGCTNDEVAEQLGCSLRTVERRLKLIRDLWEGHVE